MVDTMIGDQMNCPNCTVDRLVRKKRKGFMEDYVYPIFGLYPWKCSACKKQMLIQSRGKAIKAQPK
jgi:DNA-directed RNA polymerase subunit RPC12/RpoP